MQRYRLVDGLRALAASMVLLTHVAFWTGTSALDFSGGLLARADSGVAVFFAISAFLLLRPWISAGLDPDTSAPDLRTYALRRAVRILPAYWLALAAVLVVAGVAPERTGGIGSWPKVALHVVLLQGYAPGDYQGFSQTWSLTTEVTFYAFVPVLGLLLGRLARRGRAHLAVVLACAAGIVVQGVAAWCIGSGSEAAGSVLGTSVLGHLAWFGAGAAIALGSLGVRPHVGVRLQHWWRVVGGSSATLLAVAGLAYLLVSGPIGGPRDLQAPSVGAAIAKEALYAVIALCLLLVAHRGPATPAAQAIAESPSTRWLGDISYAVFLWHVLVLQVLHLATGAPLFGGGFWWMLVAVTCLSVLIAWASTTWLERPLLARVRRPRTDSMTHGEGAMRR